MTAIGGVVAFVSAGGLALRLIARRVRIDQVRQPVYTRNLTHPLNSKPCFSITSLSDR